MSATALLPSPFVWFVTLPANIAADRLERCLALLDDDEHARAAAFQVEPARQQFVVAHALLRTLLSKFTAVPPVVWRFARGEHGKPFVTTPADGSTLSFNLSHTDGVVMAGVCTRGDIGVDVEKIGPSADINHFGSCLSESDIGRLEKLAAADRAKGFCELWVAKEAVAKAVGTGVSSAMAGIDIVTTGGNTVSRSDDSRYAGWNVTRAILPSGQTSAVVTREPTPITFRLDTVDEWLRDAGLL